MQHVHYILHLLLHFTYHSTVAHSATPILGNVRSDHTIGQRIEPRADIPRLKRKVGADGDGGRAQRKLHSRDQKNRQGW